MKYYIRVENGKVKRTGTKPFEEQTDEIEILIQFKSEGVCKNNWFEILDWIVDNTDYTSHHNTKGI